MATPLSPNFTLEEMTFSVTALRRGLDNTPNSQQLAELKRLCETLLEPARALLALPFHVDSGFRSPALNAAVGSTAPHSAHLDGRAADIIPIGADLRMCFDKLRHSPLLPFDQIIIECNSWLHMAISPQGSAPRRESLMATGSPGHWSYQRVP